MTARNGRPEWTDPRVFQPTVLDEDGNPLIIGTPRHSKPALPAVGLQHAGIGQRRRLIDAASPALREALGNAIAVLQATALLVVSFAAAVTMLLVLTRVWG